MDCCEPGHEWRPERESASYVRYRCADCGSVCVAPKPVEEQVLVVVGVGEPPPDSDPEDEATNAPQVPLWATPAIR